MIRNLSPGRKPAAGLLNPLEKAPAGTQSMTIWGTPIRTDVASPLRVATGGDANTSSKTTAARPSAQINGAITSRTDAKRTRTRSEPACKQQPGPSPVYP
jgi:hypothetical protein